MASTPDLAHRILERRAFHLIFNPAHYSCFLQYYKVADGPERFPAREPARPGPAFDGDDEEYKIEKILDHDNRGKRKYLDHWLGWPTSDDQWIAEEDLHAPDLLTAYLTSITPPPPPKSNPKKGGVQRRGLSNGTSVRNISYLVTKPLICICDLSHGS
jgi:Chromo (CHRromatin Organisation MOdifier) domain